MTTAFHPLHKRLLALAMALLATTWLASCAGPQLADHAGERPVFDLQQYFTGDVRAYGLVSDRSGKVLRRFVVTLRGDWVGNKGTLNEQFVYDDGERQQRIWHLQRLDNGRYTGTADDVVGVAEGAQNGSAFNWHYTLSLPVDGRVYEVQFDDWMHLIDERTVINKATMSKWGLRLGEVTLSFTKL